MSGKGLLYVSPWVALAVPGLWLAARPGRRAEVATIAGVLAVYLLFSAGWDPSVWGWVAGPRHLTPLMPFLAAPAAATFSWLRDRPGTRGPLLAGMAVGLTGYSVVFFVAAILVYPHYPPELEAPLFQLALPLLAEGYAVHSVGGFLLGRTGLLPHLPVVLAALASLTLPAILWPGRASPQGRLRAGGAAAAVLVLLLVAAWIAAPGTDRTRTRAFVTGHYDPVPGSAPAFPP